jgi:Fringe-like
MPRFQNGVGNRPISIITYHLRKHTTTRGRRIILLNLVFLILFIIAFGWATSGNNDFRIPVMTGLHAGDVYYISKRALCAKSVAHEQLGIQPIAVSKVILRPVVREGENYDDRLEVLEDQLINDIVFLDRGVTGKEAELSTNVCPLHTVSVLPDRKPTRYTPSSILFGVVMAAEDIPLALQHWKYWAKDKDVAFHILLPSTDFDRVGEVEELIRITLGINVHVEANREIVEPAQLTLALVQKMLKNAGSRRVWFIILTPSTFVTSLDDVLLALEPYNAAQILYMGALSESTEQKEKHGIFAYGGAGIVLSRPLVTSLVPHSTSRVNALIIVTECFRIEDAIYGDGLLSRCIHHHTPAEFTILPTFHQCDVMDDISGILQSPLQFATIYNLIPGSFSLFPKWHKIGPEFSHPKTYEDEIDLFYQSRKILSPQNWGIRYRFGNTGRFLLTNGYSITEFLRPPYPTNYDIRNAVEGTFYNDNDVEEYTFHAAHDRVTKEVPMRYGLREGDDKRTYYLRAIEFTETRVKSTRSIKVSGNSREAAVFVYVNEAGNVRRGIEVVWLLYN